MTRWVLDITMDDIIVTTGGSEAILFTLNTITDPGDEIIIPEPFYANYNGFGISAGVSCSAGHFAHRGKLCPAPNRRV